MKTSNCLLRFLSLFISALVPGIVSAQSTTTAPVARASLSTIAASTPGQIADEAEAIKARFDLLKAAQTPAQGTLAVHTQLKQQFQRDFAAAPDEETRRELLAVYLALSRVHAAERELTRQAAKSMIGGK